MAQYKSPQSPLFQRGAQVVAFSKWDGAQFPAYSLKISELQTLPPSPYTLHLTPYTLSKRENFMVKLPRPWEADRRAVE